MGGSRVVVDHIGIGYTNRARVNFEAVSEASFTIGESEMVSLVGPSGCGKSSILSAIAGLIPYRGGQIIVDGQIVDGPGRDRAVVFQKASLLPWLSVVDNVAFGLRVFGEKKEPARERARDMLDLVGLEDFGASYPYELSGGMQQRVNLARALAVDPDTLLFDEPFASLDAQYRETLQGELLKMWEEGPSKSGLFITHQIDEAVFLADKVVVMSKGPAARVIATIPIDLPRPRTREVRLDPRFARYVEQIWGLLHTEHRNG